MPWLGPSEDAIIMLMQKKFTAVHVFHCTKGGCTHTRHNELRNSFMNLLNDVCRDVNVEPHLQLLHRETFALKSRTSDCDARTDIDIRANGLWESRFNKTYFDVNIFNSLAKIALEAVAKPISTMNLLKRRNVNKEYLRLRKQHLSVVSACSGGAGPSASKALKQLASMLSAPKEDS